MREAWWRRGVIYQVYPRSFQDTDGDGVGDLEGVRRRLDHLVALGVDALWISPFYPSPMADGGYDVSDFCGVDPLFGTLDDFDRLLADAHAKGLKVVLDVVPNHTSVEHPWFQEARASRESPKRDWYIWRGGRLDGGPPNNWLAHFGGSAWERDEATGQFYYHAYLRGQPDLNWRNPAVAAAVHEVLRFWLDRGVDGFRVDVMWHLIKDARFRDNPENPDWRPGMPASARLQELYSADRPEVHEVVAGLRRVIDEHPHRVLIGEIYLPLDRLVAYYGEGRGAHLPFNFHLLQTPWRADAVADLVRAYEAALPPGAWPNWVLGNHDRPRLATRIGEPQARVAAMLLLTLRGTPTLYYGDELGLPNAIVPPEQVRDPWGLSEPAHGRDPVRTPMPWDDGEGGGFTTGEPWLPLHGDLGRRSVAAQARDPASILNLYCRLLALRRERAALSLGGYGAIENTGNVFLYERRLGAERLLVALNLGGEPQAAALPGAGRGRALLSTCGDRVGAPVAGTLALRADEGVVVETSES